MITLALDLSTKSSGQAIYDGQKLKDYGCITSASSNLYTRIDKMIEELKNILTKEEVDAVVIEEVLPEDVRNNQSVFKALMYLQGFVCHTLNHFKLTPTFVTASHQRKMCGIRTGAGVRRESLKPKDIAFVQSQFGIKVNDDIADAICIGFSAVGGTIKEPQTIVTDDGFEFG